MRRDLWVGVGLGSATSTLVLATVVLVPDGGGNMADGSPQMWLRIGAALCAVGVCAAVARHLHERRAHAWAWLGALVGASAGLFLFLPVFVWLFPMLVLSLAAGLLWTIVGTSLGFAIGWTLPRSSTPLRVPVRWRRWPLALVALAMTSVGVYTAMAVIMAGPTAFLVAWAWGTTRPTRPRIVGAAVGGTGAILALASLWKYGVSIDPQRLGLDAAASLLGLLLAVGLCAWFTATVCRLAAAEVDDVPGAGPPAHAPAIA